MEPTTNNSKIVLSVRISAFEKQKLAERAEALDITLSEHAERILLNADNISTGNESEHLKKENEVLLQRVDALKSQVAILSTPVLLKLFEQVKGVNDEVETPDGKTFTITYNSPLDLLYTMIHSFKLK